MEKENKKLRELLWLRHGCSFFQLYGDDGEMQCTNCMIDFKRESVENISSKFAQRGTDILTKHFKSLEKRETNGV